MANLLIQSFFTSSVLTLFLLLPNQYNRKNVNICYTFEIWSVLFIISFLIYALILG